MTSQRRTVWFVVAVLLLGFGWFVWPTPYHFRTEKPFTGTVVLLRFNRVTRDVQILEDGEWQHFPGYEAYMREKWARHNVAVAAPDNGSDLGEAELKQIEFRPLGMNEMFIRAYIVNRTQRVVRSLKVTVMMRPHGSSMGWTRYDLHESAYLRPDTSTEILINTVGLPQEKLSLAWTATITAASAQ